MSTTTVTPQPETPVFDAKSHIEARMAGKPAPIQQARAEDPKPEVKPEPEPERKADTTRSQRRAMRAAEERTANLVLKVLNETGVLQKKSEDKQPEAPAEPKRADFPAGDDGLLAFQRAVQKFDKEQEKKQAESRQTEQEEIRERYQQLDAKTVKDIEEHFPDWDKLAKEWAANEDIQAVKYEDIPTIVGLLANSDMRAAVSYHWMQNPEDFLELCEKSPQDQIRAFHRLEGKLEREYSTKKPAQGSEPEKGKEDRKHPAEAEKPGGTAATGQVAKPRPSSEVVARGGSPPPDSPPIGSAAWMQERNQRVHGK